MKKAVDKEKLERYKAALPYGGQKEAAELAGVTRKTICCFLRGDHHSMRVELAVLEVIRRHKVKLEISQRAAGLL